MLTHASHIGEKQYSNASKRPFFDAPIQTKLTVNEPGDAYEQEADAVADKVMRMPDPSVQQVQSPFNKVSISSLQRKCATCDEEEKVQRKEDGEEEQPIQLKPISDFAIQRQCADCEKDDDKIHLKEASSTGGGMSAPPIVSDVISSGGASLDKGTQQFMESRMGQDFSTVQVHTDSKAAESAQSINALAYTSGNHVVFNSGQYAPDTEGGRRLLAHELTHVAQQTAPTSNKILTSKNNKQIQRFIYWSGLKSPNKPYSGNDAESKLTEALQAGDKDLKTQSPIPNANRDGQSGIGFTGRADLFKGAKTLEIYFGYPATTPCSDGTLLGTPLPTRTGGNLKPTSDEGVKKFIRDAPTNIALGEIKPADSDHIAFGKKQIKTYKAGIEFAKNQFNCWAQKNNVSERWSIGKSQINDMNPEIPNDFKYNPSSPKSDLNLGVFDFGGNDDVKLSIKSIKPSSISINIKGGLYFENAGDGVIIYFFRPINVEDAIKTLGTDKKSNEFKEYLNFASQLQDGVVSPLMSAPDKVVQGKFLPNPIQKKPKKEKKVFLNDTFNLDVWKGNHQKFQDNFKTKNVNFRDKLEYLEQIKEAEQTYYSSPVAKGSSKLPVEKVAVGHSKGKTIEKETTEIFSWMELWSREPIKYLGFLRKKMGGAFVKIAGFFERIQSKIGGKLSTAEQTHSPKDNSWGDLAVRAFWLAIVSIGTMITKKTGHLLVDSLQSGLKQRLSQYIPLDKAGFMTMLENEFPILKTIEQKVQSLEEQFGTAFDGFIDKFDTLIATFKKVADNARTYGNIIKWVNVAVQCGTPPGIGCLKILATELGKVVIGKILNWCWTKKKFAWLVKNTGVIDQVPKQIGQFIAEGVESFLPDSFIPVFDKTIFEQKVSYDEDDVPCGDQITEAEIAMSELHEVLMAKLGMSDYLKLCDALEKYGIPSSHKLSADEIRAITSRVPDMLGIEIAKYLDMGKGKEHKQGEPIDIANFLSQVKKITLEEDLPSPSESSKTGGSKEAKESLDLGFDKEHGGSGSSMEDTTVSTDNNTKIFEAENIHGQTGKGAGKFTNPYEVLGIKEGQYPGDLVKVSILAHFNSKSGHPIIIVRHGIPAKIKDRKYYLEYPNKPSSFAKAKIIAVFIEIKEVVYFHETEAGIKASISGPQKLNRPVLISKK
jgi:Domain of unknown function (DUF4157)